MSNTRSLFELPISQINVGDTVYVIPRTVKPHVPFRIRKGKVQQVSGTAIRIENVTPGHFLASTYYFASTIDNAKLCAEQVCDNLHREVKQIVDDAMELFQKGQGA